MADNIQPSDGHWLQKREKGEYRLTTAKRQAFLDELAGSANVNRAARAAGAMKCSFYRLRRRDADFARSWDEALATGYDVLEAELMAQAMGTSGDEGTGDDGPALVGDPARATARPLDRELALALLKRRDTAANRPAGERRRGGTRTRNIPMAEVEATLMRQLELLEKRLAKKPPCEVCGRA